MADVSHELGALRFVVDSSLSSKVAMFNKQTQQHQQQQLLNPFSSATGRMSPKPSFSKDEYGKPLAGSLTEMRGQKANMHVLREMLELCQIIDSEGYNVKDEPNMRVIPFGELFNIYNYISDKVVGILLRARKHKLLDFEGEMLFQRRDDDVPIFLLKPIAEIRQELQLKIEDIKRAGSPAPQATSLLLDKSAHKQKLASRGSTPSNSPAPSKPATPAHSKASSPAHSKASSPAPMEQVPAVTPQTTAQPTKTDAQAAPEVTITAAPVVEATEVVAAGDQMARLEGGEQPNVPTEKSDATAPADNNIVVPEVVAPTVAEHVELPPVSVSTANITNPNATENSELPTIVIDAAAVYTRTAPAPAEDASAVAAAATAPNATITENTTANSEGNPQA